MNNQNLVLDVEQSPKSIWHTLLFALQHVLAVLVATITVPLLIPGLPIAATMISAGIGTLFYVIVTKKKSPVFLSSSFAYISPMTSALAIGGIANASGNPANYAALMIGMGFVGIIYISIAILIKLLGTGWLNKLLPPIIVGPVIIVIGLSLSGSAISNLTMSAGGDTYNLLAIVCGVFALFMTAIAAVKGKEKMLGLIPFVVGISSGYLLALILTLVGYNACNNTYFKLIDFTPLVSIFQNFSFASIFNYNLFLPNTNESFIFLRFEELAKFDWASIGQIALLFIPVSLVTCCEHIGDHKNLGNIIGRDLLNQEPGMCRTLIGDGVATAISGSLCGAANTTYGESVSVVGTTKIASIKVIITAAIMIIVFGLFTPFTMLLRTIPNSITGGVGILLYGFIASSGVKMIISEKIDFNEPKNIFVAAVILVCGIGGFILKFGDPKNPTIQITSIAVSMILGIILNTILNLVEKKKLKN